MSGRQRSFTNCTPASPTSRLPPPLLEPFPPFLPPLSPHWLASQCLTGDGEEQVSLGVLSHPSVRLYQRPCRDLYRRETLGTAPWACVLGERESRWGPATVLGSPTSACSLGTPVGTAGSSQRISGIQPPGALSAREVAAASHSSEPPASVRWARSSESAPAIARGASRRPVAGSRGAPLDAPGQDCRDRAESEAGAGYAPQSWARVGSVAATSSRVRSPPPFPVTESATERSWCPGSRLRPRCWCPLLWGRGNAGGWEVMRLPAVCVCGGGAAVVRPHPTHISDPR